MKTILIMTLMVPMKVINPGILSSPNIYPSIYAKNGSARKAFEVTRGLKNIKQRTYPAEPKNDENIT